MYFGGDVYSSVDPFATALGVADSKVSFIGSDEAALALDPAAVDLGGDLLAPGFVHAGLILDGAAPGAAELHDRGFTHVHVLGEPGDVEEFRAGAPAGLDIVDYPAVGSGSGSEEDPGPRLSMSAAEFLAAKAFPEAAVYLRVADNAELVSVLERLSTNSALAQRSGYRLHADFGVDVSLVEDLGRSGIALSLAPSAQQPLAQLLSAGAQVSWLHSDASPWAAVRSALGTENGISARAAFNAATRFAHRAAGNPEGGVLAPGARADFVRWQVERLVVQVSDSRVAAWSTDPRSGTPGLPELSADVALPVRVDL